MTKQNQTQQQTVILNNDQHGIVISVLCDFRYDKIASEVEGTSWRRDRQGIIPKQAMILKTIFKGKTIKVDCPEFDSRKKICLNSHNHFDDNRCYLFDTE